MARLDRSNTENKIPALAAAWDKAGLPDDVADLPRCSTPGSTSDARHVPRSVVVAAADLVVSTRIRGNNRRRAALMIVDPHAPDGQTAAENDPTVVRWVKIIDRQLSWVHAFDKKPPPITEAQLVEDFVFLEEVMRGVLAPLDVVADLDDLLAQTRPASSAAEDPDGGGAGTAAGDGEGAASLDGGNNG
ncbi:hypothetical protein ACIRSS_23700 [Amycolatopsis sp. NPDC101161]|uniref:hypothetical protein n=1 Tax=Amycolatopsis sp. NPDC101161 TaxID=3363940 RepID=UPI0038273B85